MVFSLVALMLNGLFATVACLLAGFQAVPLGIAIALANLTLLGAGLLIGSHYARRAEIIVAALNSVAKGDLTHHLKLAGKDDFAWLAYEYDGARRGMVKLVDGISRSSREVGRVVGDLTQATAQIAHASQEQSSAASGINLAMDAATVSIARVAENAEAARQIAEQASGLASQGKQEIDSVVREIESTSAAVQQSSSMIVDLGKKSETISSIVQTIKGIADQTNLLALNAAIEAARAGEQGRGFAVVADEVRKLAERSSSAANDITTMISSMVSGTQQAVQGMNHCVSRVDAGVQSARAAGQSVVALDESARKTRAQIEEIAAAMRQQSQATQAIGSHVELISRMAEDNRGAVTRSQEVVGSLTGLSGELQTSVATFRAH